DCGVSSAVEQTDLSIREVPHHFLDYRHGRVGLVRHAEKEFVFGIVLSAETRKIFISVRIQPSNGLEIAYRRSEIKIFPRLFSRLPKVTAGTVDGQKVEDK